MPLFGYMKINDPGRISTISVAGDKSRIRRKQLIPTRHDSTNSRTTMYVRDCLEHGLGGIVPVELFRGEAGDWKSLGIAKCCVLCWLIIEPPPDSNLPEPIPLPVGTVLKKELGIRQVGKRTNRGTLISKAAKTTLNRLKELFDGSSEEFTISELVTMYGIPRATLNRLLERLENEGLLFKEIQEINGRRKITYSSEKTP